jgi:hypothetical protein
MRLAFWLIYQILLEYNFNKTNSLKLGSLSKEQNTFSITWHSSICPSSSIPSRTQCFGNGICLCHQVERRESIYSAVYVWRRKSDSFNKDSFCKTSSTFKSRGRERVDGRVVPVYTYEYILAYFRVMRVTQNEFCVRRRRNISFCPIRSIFKFKNWFLNKFAV